MLSKPKPLVNLFNWNPQLFREIKGRFKIRNVAIVIFASLLCQFLFMRNFLSKLPEKYGADIIMNKLNNYHYCIQPKEYYCTGINWSNWWTDIFLAFSWFLFTLTLLGGVYILVANFVKEERLGTLNFIRLSPQSSEDILLGKFLGVPILIYLVTILFLPLHLWANISSGLSLYLFFAFYAILILSCCFFYNASLIFVFLGGNQPWLATILVGMLSWPIMAYFHSEYYRNFNLINGYKYDIDEFYYLHPEEIVILIIVFILLIYWIWQAVNRCYRNPNSTIISKKQSYWFMACLQVAILIFCFHIIEKNSSYIFDELLSILLPINLFIFLLLITFLSSQRQTLQDWARHRHLQVNNDETVIVKGLALSLKQDLIWGEKSPPLVAIGINLVITATIWISGILLFNHNQINGITLPAILTLILSLNLILIYAVIIQLVLLMKVKNPKIWAVGILGSLIALPPIALLLLLITPENSPNIWLFSNFPWFSLAHNSLAITPMLITIVAHWSVFTLLTLQLTRKIQKLGASDSHKLYQI